MFCAPPRGAAWLGILIVAVITLGLNRHAALADVTRQVYRLPVRQEAPTSDASTQNVLVALAPLSRTSPVELVDVTLDANLSESEDGHTLAQGNSTFKLHNTLSADPVTLPLGFPGWAGGDLSFDPSQFSSFALSTDNNQVALDRATAPLKIGKEVRAVTWYSFTVTLGPDEKKVIRVDFSQDLGSNLFPRFTYGLVPSSGWKGAVGSTRLTLHLPKPTTEEQFIQVSPSDDQFDGQNMTWLDIGEEPDSPRTTTFIRFSVWDGLLAKRSATAQNPNDSNAHFSLAQAYSQLASADSPKRADFLSRQLAELETSTRLNPRNADATLMLAQFYEGQATLPGAPRDPAYTALALGEWQNLIGTKEDADARQHSAEDSFFLAVTARAAGDNDLALKYLADAARFAPNGAGPPYTRDNWQTEMQAAHAALARAALKDGDLKTALEHARAVFGDNMDLAPAPPLPAFALEHAAVRTTSSERQITISLYAYPSFSPDAEQAIASIVTALNRTGAGSATFSGTDTEHAITIRVPTRSSAELYTRLSKLAAALPVRQDWGVIARVIAPSSLEWSDGLDTFYHTWHYREVIDLTPASLQATLDSLSSEISQLQGTKSRDAPTDLRLALLEDIQAWWQRTTAASFVTYDLKPTVGAEGQWSMNLGEKETLESDAKELRGEWYLIGAVSALVLLCIAVLFLVLVRTIRRRRMQRGLAA